MKKKGGKNQKQAQNDGEPMLLDLFKNINNDAEQGEQIILPEVQKMIEEEEKKKRDQQMRKIKEKEEKEKRELEKIKQEELQKQLQLEEQEKQKLLQIQQQDDQNKNRSISIVPIILIEPPKQQEPKALPSAQKIQINNNNFFASSQALIPQTSPDSKRLSQQQQQQQQQQPQQIDILLPQQNETQLLITEKESPKKFQLQSQLNLITNPQTNIQVNQQQIVSMSHINPAVSKSGTGTDEGSSKPDSAKNFIKVPPITEPLDKLRVNSKGGNSLIGLNDSREHDEKPIQSIQQNGVITNNNNMFIVDDNSFCLKDAELKTKQQPQTQQKRKSFFDVDDDDQLAIDMHQYTTLEALSDFCKTIGKQCNRLQQIFQDCSIRIEKAFKCRVQITAAFMYVMVFFIAVAIGYILLTKDSEDLASPPAFDRLKKYVAGKLVTGALIFTFYGIIFLQISQSAILIALFLIQGMPSMFVFLYQCYDAYITRNDSKINEPDYIISLYVFVLYVFWLATYLIKDDLQKHFNSLIKNMFLAIWCLLGAAFIGGYTIYSICTSLELNFSWSYRLVTVVAAPYIILVCLSWVYMHFRYFHPSIQSIQQYSASNDEDKLSNSSSKSLGDENKGLLSNYNNNINNSGIADQISEHNNQQKSSQEPQTQIKNQEKNSDKPQNSSGELVPQPNSPQPLINHPKKELKQITFKEQQQNIQKYIQNYIVIFSSFAIGGSMITLTILSVIYIAHALSLGEMKHLINEPAFFMNLFMSCFVPFFTLTGTGLIFSKVEERYKLILIPILGALIPLCFSMPFSLVVDSFKEMRPLRKFFTLGPSLVAIYWVTLIWIKISKWRVSMLMNGYICLFFLVPLVYILPLRDVEQYQQDDSVAQYFEIILIVIGVLIILALIFFDLIVILIRTYMLQGSTSGKNSGQDQDPQKGGDQEEDEFTKSERFELMNIFRYDLEHFGLWGNSFGYILTMSILIFMYYNKPVWIKPNQSGTLIGMQFVIFFLFLWCLILLLLKVIPEQQKAAISFSEQLAQMIQAKREKDVIIDRQNKVRRLVMHIGFIDIPIILVVLLFIINSKENDEIQAEIITALIGIIVVTIIFVFFFEIKKTFDDFSKTAIPALVVFCWIFLYLPFAGILPSAMFYLSINSEDLVMYERMVVGITALLLIVGLSLVAVLVHLYFKRIDFEKKFKFIASKVIKKMAKIHVKCDFNIVNLVYQGYVSLNADDVKDSMINQGKPVFWIKISKYNPDTRFSKMIIDAEAYQKLKNKKKSVSTWRDKLLNLVFRFCCCYNDPSKRVGASDQQEMEHLIQNEDEDDDNAEDEMQRMMDEALEENLRKQEEEALVIEVDPWMKTYLLGVRFRPIPDKIIEPLRRYDLPQNLQISKPRQEQFLKAVFQLFAQGSRRKFDIPWIDYIMYKQLLVLSAIVPCREIEDWRIDKIYAKYTQADRFTNANPITESRFSGLLTQIATLKYPNLPPEDALGKLVKLWMFPYLLWNIIAIRVLYFHEWDYVLFLLKMYGFYDLWKEFMESQDGFRLSLEKELGILPLDADAPNPDLIIPEDKPMKTCKQQFADCITDWCRSFSENQAYFCKSFCYMEKDQKDNGMDEIEVEANLVQNTLLKPPPIINKKKRIIQHQESPEWPEIVDQMVTEIQDQEKEFMRMKDAEFKNLTLRNNWTNKLAIFFRVIEFISLATLAFRPQFEWGIPDGIIQILNFFNTMIPDTPILTSYLNQFWFSFSTTLVYLIASYQTVLRIRSGIYGSSEYKNSQVNLISWDFLLIFIVNGVSYAIYLFCFKMFMDTFSCDYSIVPQSLYMDNSIECLTPLHTKQIVFAVISILLIYPLGTFLFPNIQYQNKSLDLRYDPTYLVLRNQVNFLVAGSAAFFAHQDIVIYQSIASAIILLGFGILARMMKPCLIKKFNPLEMGGYLLAGWMHVSAIVLKLTDSKLAASICLLLGGLLIILVSVSLFKLLHNRQLKQQKGRKKRSSSQLLGPNGEALQDDYNSDEEESEFEDENKKKEQQKEESQEYKIWKAINDIKLLKEKEYEQEKKEVEEKIREAHPEKFQQAPANPEQKQNAEVIGANQPIQEGQILPQQNNLIVEKLDQTKPEASIIEEKKDEPLKSDNRPLLKPKPNYLQKKKR